MSFTKGFIGTAAAVICLLASVANASSKKYPSLVFAILEDGSLKVVTEVSANGDYRLRPLGSGSAGKWYSKDSVAVTDRTLCREAGKCIDNTVIDTSGATLIIGGFFPNGDYAVSPLGSGNYYRHDGKDLATTTTGIPTKGIFAVGDFIRNDRGQHFRISGVYANGDLALREMLPEVSRSTRTNSMDFALANCGTAIGPNLRACRPFDSSNGESWIVEGVYANGDLLVKGLYSLGYAHRMTREAFQEKFKNASFD